MTRWLAFAGVVLAAASARADVSGQCHVVSATFVPIDGLQIVGWIEKLDGTYVDTIYITQKTGHYGLGNRPGRFDFNSGPPKNDMWPFGRRTTTFPVWAHRHGKTFPLIVFQDLNENDMSKPVAQTSPEHPPFCAPMLPAEPSWDAGTCATATPFSDKGMFDPRGGQSPYPPRADLVREPDFDSPSVDMYKALDVFDAVSQATPIGGMQTQIVWLIPPSLPTGSYVLWIEANKEYDFNAAYNFPSPTGIPFGEYGIAYRGQPAVTYRVPFAIAAGDTAASTATYAGYADPDGATGTLHPPDATITTAAQRLEMIPGTTDRIQVRAHDENDSTPPANLTTITPTIATSLSITLRFIAPGDDGMAGTVAGFDVRYRTDGPVTAQNFDDPRTSKAILSYTPAAAGTMQSLELDGLLPQTDYYIGIRAYDDCRNTTDVASVQVTTAPIVGGYIDACFVATAAYGSRMAGDVEPLRRFRDHVLKTSVLGELAVETYYTFGPPVAGAVGSSELLRAAARDVLAPIVTRVRALGM